MGGVIIRAPRTDRRRLGAERAAGKRLPGKAVRRVRATRIWCLENIAGRSCTEAVP
jgi:hypothetical protein